jgi:hypothetical protein
VPAPMLCCADFLGLGHPFRPDEQAASVLPTFLLLAEQLGTAMKQPARFCIDTDVN